jgi:hypothetical protein
VRGFAQVVGVVLVLLAFAMSGTAQPPQTVAFERRQLEWQSATRESEAGGVVAFKLHTNRGDIVARYHPAESPNGGGVVWVGGAGGGLDGPARGIYVEAAERLHERGVASLRLHYRRPNDLVECVLDTLVGVAFLQREGVKNVALVGGAVVISAGAKSPHVKAVVPMSTQTYGADLAPAVAPRAMLLIHGTADDVLPARCSEQIYAMAREPKEIRLLPGNGHGLDESRQEVLDLLLSWIPRQLGR